MTAPVPNESLLLVTLDSCRFDTFEAAELPHLRGIGSLHRAHAPGNFTYSSHAAMFMGFTPGVASLGTPYVNPKYGKIVRLAGGGSVGRAQPLYALEGHNIVDGFRRAGFATIGTGAVGWFDTRTPTGHALTSDFEEFLFSGTTWSLPTQLEFVHAALDAAGDRPSFVFVNVGETHVPYWHEGASWDRQLNPCVPFGTDNDAAECRRRQRACLEYVDAELQALLARFAEASTVICADHGDAWGEDGLWEHGVHHPAVLEVPLLMRLRHRAT